MIIITKLINFSVFVKYFELFVSFSYGNLIRRIHAANISPNIHTVKVPPLVMALIPQRHIPQFKAKKKTSTMHTTNTDSCDKRDANMEIVITTVSIAQSPEMNTDDDIEDVELKTWAKADSQKQQQRVFICRHIMTIKRQWVSTVQSRLRPLIDRNANAILYDNQVPAMKNSPESSEVMAEVVMESVLMKIPQSMIIRIQNTRITMPNITDYNTIIN